MERIKLDKNKNTYKMVSFGVKRVKITPYIDTELQMVLFNLCEKTLCENRIFFDVHKMPLFKTIFNMVVVSQCSNVEVQGIERVDNENGGYMVDLDINQELIRTFENSKLAKKIIKKIDNYESVWGMIEAFIHDSVIITVFSALGNSVPTSEEFAENINDMIKVLENISEKEPKVVQDTFIKPMAKKTKSDIVKEKNESKKNGKTKKVDNG